MSFTVTVAVLLYLKPNRARLWCKKFLLKLFEQI